MRSYEFTAKSVEKAIKLGLDTLNKKQEDVDIKIISEGGLFKKAKIVINIEDEPVLTNFAKTAPKAEPANEVKPEPKKEVKEEKVEVKKEEKVENPELKTEIKDEVELGREIKVAKEPISAEEKARRYEEKHYSNNTTSVNFVQGLMEAMNITAKIELTEKKDSSSISIETEDAGKIIGHRGECLNAIQYLANIVEQKTNPTAKRVVIDAGDYKERREESLRALAIRVAGKVEATGRPYKLEPMNAYERRIIHTELQNYSAVETHSEGVEPHRRLIVSKKK